MTNEEGHRLLWRTMAEQRISKGDAWELLGFDKTVADVFANRCFACLEAGVKSDLNPDIDPNCKKCPIDWGDGCPCETKGSLYKKYVYERSIVFCIPAAADAAADLALQISKLFWKSRRDNP
jgi:hypothetical protein